MKRSGGLCVRSKGEGNTGGKMRCVAGTMGLSRAVKFPFRAALEAPVSHALPALRVCAEVTHAHQWKRGLWLCFGICLPFFGDQCCPLSALSWTETKEWFLRCCCFRFLPLCRAPSSCPALPQQMPAGSGVAAKR